MTGDKKVQVLQVLSRRNLKNFWASCFTRSGQSASKRSAVLVFAVLVCTIMMTRIQNLQNDPITMRELDEEMLSARLKGPLTYDDPGLLKVIQQQYLVPPSQRPYNLMIDRDDHKAGVYNSYFVLEPSFRILKDILLKILGGIDNGFFVEAGAVDGEFLSNSLVLERQLGWKGLLVEADGDMFKNLLTRNRKAWASHSCLALHKYPHREIFIKYSASDDLFPGTSMFSRGHGVLSSVEHLSPMKVIGAAPRNSDPLYEPVQCLPLASLLLALNVSHVHFVSLDVEGAETAVLGSFPWNVITVDVWLVEYVTAETTTDQQPQTPSAGPHARHHKNKNNLTPGGNNLNHASHNSKIKTGDPPEKNFIQLFLSRGYYLYPMDKERLKYNYLFIRLDSEVYKSLGIK